MITWNPITRTPEEGHSPACLASAIISAIQNYRDAICSDAKSAGKNPLTDSIAQFDFRTWSQNNGMLTDADDLLATQLQDCICPTLEKI